MHHVIVLPLVSETLGQRLSRAAMLAVLNRLRDQLQEYYSRYRSRRDPENPDDMFEYAVCLGDEFDEWHTLRFIVNDRIAAGYLFVASVSYRSGKVRPR